MSPSLDPSTNPIVYLGPSLSAEEARTLLPGGIFKRPVRRGDLFRAREMGARVLLVIDGVFMQDAAISPREVVEVVRDGALVYGASSMGALRAAECWPVGVRGVGLVYRLFRAGVIDSDDEVAVSIDPAGGFKAASVALVNVRHAVLVARRKRVIDRETASRLVSAATSLFYPQRRWRTIFHEANVSLDAGQRSFLESQDLKHDDAVRAVTLLARALTEPGVFERHARSRSGPVARSKEIRERFYDPLGGRSLEDVRRDLARWLVGSGRAARHATAILSAHLAREASTASPIAVAAHRWLVDREPVRSSTARPVELRRALARSMASAFADERALAESLWHELATAGELDAELMRMHAVMAASARARENGLAARTIDRHLAEQEIAFARGFNSWEDLRADRGQAWPWVDEARDQLALAKRLRDHVFNAPRQRHRDGDANADQSG